MARGDVIMINREKGCGTRILLDQKIALLGISGSEISGYTRESTSHLACAATVARGGADAACGCENAALNIRTVDFIPLQKEWHDLVYRKEDESLSHIQRIIEIAQSPAFRQDLEAAAGYDTSQTGLVLS